MDGSLLPALPKMAWVHLWLDEQHSRAAKLHSGDFDVFKARTVLCHRYRWRNGNEKKQLHAALQSGRTSTLIDRGYAWSISFFLQDIHDADSHFIVAEFATTPCTSWSRNALLSDERAQGRRGKVMWWLGSGWASKAARCSSSRYVWSG